jgi:hypothetical protein
MTRMAWQIALACAAMCLLAYGCASLGGCSGASLEAAYTSALLRCVDRATTLAESRSCRAAVDRAYHVDGGR